MRSEATLSEWVANDELQGARVYLERGGETLIHFAVGCSAPGVTALTRDRFRFYCAVKPLVAACLLQDAEEGRIRLDDLLGQFIPTIDDRLGNLRIDELLSHSSRLAPSTDDPYAESFSSYLSRLTLVDGAVTWWPDPVYCNTAAWHLLGGVLESVHGEGVASVVRSRLCETTGAELTGSVDGFSQLYVQQGRGRFRLPSGPDEQHLCTRPNPAHGGIGSVEDLGRFYGELLRCVQGRGRILSAASLLAARRPAQTMRISTHRRLVCGLGLQVNLPEWAVSKAWSVGTFGHIGSFAERTVVIGFADPVLDVAAAISLSSVDARSSWRVATVSEALLADACG